MPNVIRNTHIKSVFVFATKKKGKHNFYGLFFHRETQSHWPMIIFRCLYGGGANSVHSISVINFIWSERWLKTWSFKNSKNSDINLFSGNFRGSSSKLHIHTRKLCSRWVTFENEPMLISGKMIAVSTAVDYTLTISICAAAIKWDPVKCHWNHKTKHNKTSNITKETLDFLFSLTCDFFEFFFCFSFSSA